MYEVHLYTDDGVRAVTPWQKPCGEWICEHLEHPRDFDDIASAWRAAKGIAIQFEVKTAVVDTLVRFPVAVFNEFGDLNPPAPLQSDIKTGS